MAHSARHSELEIKIDASHIDRLKLFKWCNQKNPIEVVYASGPDDMYVNATNVIRHRFSADGKFNQLTVKKRKSKHSTLNRLEIDLDFEPETTVSDVSSFLLALGWKKSFTIIKNAWIFVFDNVTVVYYNAYRKDKPNKIFTFIEVEIEKSFDLNLRKSKQLLNKWKKEIAKEFKTKEPLNKSLWEIFSGKKTNYIKGKR